LILPPDKQADIKRATARAQRDMDALDAAVTMDLLAIYRRAARDIEADILAAAGAGAVVRLEALQQLLAQVNGRLSALETARNSLLNTNLDAAARLGVQPFAGVGIDTARIAGEAADAVQSLVAADKLQLSDRIWRIDRGAREQVARAIESAVIQGHSADQAVREFLGRGQAVPAELAAKVGAAAPGGLARATGAALLRDEDNAYFKAERVFRTELNRAHGLAYEAGAAQTPGAIGLQFLLSPAHPRPDQCDLHASANLYGLGRGIYPFGRSPWPAHPNTLSYQVIVFEDEVTDADREGRESALDWLGAQDAATQTSVLGGRAKRAALVAGVLKESDIRVPWQELKARYARRGVDVDALARGGA
jgi:hypothetical protein